MPATLHQGATGFDVAVMQLQLNLKSSAARPLRVGSGFGPLTRAALVAFQSRNGLAADGIAGPKTHAALAQGLNISAVHQAMTHIAQLTNANCWAASTAMMKRSTEAAVRARTPANMLASDGGLANSSESDQAVITGSRYGAIHCLRCHAPMSWSVSGLIAALRRSPLMFDMLWNTQDYTAGNGSPGHMVVISAVISDNNTNSAGTYLLVLDPWPPHRGKVSWVEYGQWMREVPTRTYRVFECN